MATVSETKTPKILCKQVSHLSHQLSPKIDISKTRHDIFQMFYTSTVSKILKFTRENARKSLLILVTNITSVIYI